MKSGLALETPPAIVLAHEPSFRLGAVEVRPATRELIGPEAREVIEPRVMQVLVALGRTPGEILSRDDLIGCCWEGRVVGEDAINRVLSKLRKLGHSVAADSFEIETITKVGYRLMLREATVPAPPAPAAVSTTRMSRRALLTGGLLAAVGAGGAGWLALREEANMSPEAAMFYRRGAEALRQGLPENNAAAIGYLREAVTLAPQSAEAWAKLAVAYQIGRNALPPPEAEAARERARSAATRALELEPNHPTALAAQALDIPVLGRWLDVERACRQILSIDPDQKDAVGLLSHVLAQVGRTNETLAMIRQIGPEVEMIPLLAFRHAVLLWAAGRIEESDRVMDRAMALSPRNYVIWFTRYWLYARTGRGREALALSANRAMRPAGIPDSNFDLNDLGARALMTRAPGDVAAALRANREAAANGSGFAENAIMVAAQLGALDQAFEVADAYYLGRGFQIGPGRFTAQQGVYTDRGRRLTAFLWTPSCRDMRADPRFMPLMGKIGLLSYWRRSGTRPDVMAI